MAVITSIQSCVSKVTIPYRKAANQRGLFSHVRWQIPFISGGIGLTLLIIIEPKGTFLLSATYCHESFVIPGALGTAYERFGASIDNCLLKLTNKQQTERYALIYQIISNSNQGVRNIIF